MQAQDGTLEKQYSIVKQKQNVGIQWGAKQHQLCYLLPDFELAISCIKQNDSGSAHSTWIGHVDIDDSVY